MSSKNSIIKLPGLVDVHTHIREPGNTHKEDFYSGTQAAIAGGYTQILDMPNNDPPTVTPKALEEKEKLAKGRIWCDVGFNFGATGQSAKYFGKIAKITFGLKLYMSRTTGPIIVDENRDLEEIFKRWPNHIPIMIHAEGELVERAIKLASKFQKSIHICHLTADQLPSIDKAKKHNVQVSCEVTPHHLFLNKKDEKRLKGFGIMKPPLSTPKDQKKLWDNIEKIDVIATDHAPHTLDEKMQKPPAFGVTGLETTLPLMFTAIAAGKLTTERLIEMCATNPRRIFHLPPQQDTYVLVDFSPTYKISASNFFTKNKWTPFEGMDGRGVIKKVTLRSKAVFVDGKFLGKPQGKVISPQN